MQQHPSSNLDTKKRCYKTNGVGDPQLSPIKQATNKSGTPKHPPLSLSVSLSPTYTYIKNFPKAFSLISIHFSFCSDFFYFLFFGFGSAESDLRTVGSDPNGGVEAATGFAIASGEQGLRRLFAEESAMGVGVVRRVHVPRVLRQAPRPRRPHLLRPIRHHGLLVRDPDQENGVRRQRAAQLVLRAVRDR